MDLHPPREPAADELKQQPEQPDRPWRGSVVLGAAAEEGAVVAADAEQQRAAAAV